MKKHTPKVYSFNAYPHNRKREVPSFTIYKSGKLSISSELYGDTSYTDIVRIRFNQYGLVIGGDYDSDSMDDVPSDVFTSIGLPLRSQLIIKDKDLVNAIIDRFRLLFGKRHSIKFYYFQVFEMNDSYAYVIPLIDKLYIKEKEFKAAPICSFNVAPKEVKVPNSDRPALKIVKAGNGYRLVFSSDVIHQFCYPFELSIKYTTTGIILSDVKEKCTGFALHPIPEQVSFAVYSTQLAKCILKRSLVIGTSKGTTVFKSFKYLGDQKAVLIPFLQ